MGIDKTTSVSILVIDDNPVNLDACELMLKSAGYDSVITCQGSVNAIKLLSEYPIGLILLDLVMPEISGESLLPQIIQKFPYIPVIIVSGKNKVDSAVRCMKDGAFDYIEKPVDFDRLSTVVRNAIKVYTLQQENLSLKTCCDLSVDLNHPEAFDCFNTHDKSMIELFGYVESIATSDKPVLISGETGVGKELMGKVIHRLSNRKGRMTSVNVAEIDDSFFSDTLFGHVPGAFTGATQSRKGLVESASKGTLFLDEIGELSLESQVKLLRLIQEKEYYRLGEDTPSTMDARLISATNRDLWKLQRNNRFREDLNHRLRTHHVHIPPLRERPEDIPLLIDKTLKDVAKKHGKPKPYISQEIYSLLKSYPFHGNVRELKYLVAEFVIHQTTNTLTLQNIRKRMNDIGGFAGHHVDRKSIWQVSKTFPTIKEATGELIDQALKISNGNQSAAARLLGITPQALNKRILKKKS